MIAHTHHSGGKSTMNCENKRKSFEKGYYKTHACSEVFPCKNCGHVVVPAGAGSAHRNHCPNCLCSLHVDEEPGDRASACGGLMEPVAVWVRKGGADGRRRNHEVTRSKSPMSGTLTVQTWGFLLFSALRLTHGTAFTSSCQHTPDTNTGRSTPTRHIRRTAAGPA